MSKHDEVVRVIGAIVCLAGVLVYYWLCVVREGGAEIAPLGLVVGAIVVLVQEEPAMGMKQMGGVLRLIRRTAIFWLITAILCLRLVIMEPGFGLWLAGRTILMAIPLITSVLLSWFAAQRERDNMKQ